MLSRLLFAISCIPCIVVITSASPVEGSGGALWAEPVQQALARAVCSPLPVSPNPAAFEWKKRSRRTREEKGASPWHRTAQRRLEPHFPSPLPATFEEHTLFLTSARTGQCPGFKYFRDDTAIGFPRHRTGPRVCLNPYFARYCPDESESTAPGSLFDDFPPYVWRIEEVPLPNSTHCGGAGHLDSSISNSTAPLVHFCDVDSLLSGVELAHIRSKLEEVYVESVVLCGKAKVNATLGVLLVRSLEQPTQATVDAIRASWFTTSTSSGASEKVRALDNTHSCIQ